MIYKFTHDNYIISDIEIITEKTYVSLYCELAKFNFKLTNLYHFGYDKLSPKIVVVNIDYIDTSTDISSRVTFKTYLWYRKLILEYIRDINIDKILN